jgi:hypothetical protein
MGDRKAQHPQACGNKIGSWILVATVLKVIKIVLYFLDIPKMD